MKMTMQEKLELLDAIEQRNAEAESRYIMQRKARIKAEAQAFESEGKGGETNVVHNR